MPAYGLNDVNVDLGGRALTGFGESDAFSWKHANDRWDVVPCCDGAVVFNRIESANGEITVTARYDSPINRILYQLAQAGSDFSFSATFPNGDVVESPECRVMKYPEPSAGAKTGDYVWTLTCNPLRTPYALGV